MTLRSKIIRLAHANPELRPHLLPLVKEAAVKMQGTSPYVRMSTHVMTFFYDPVDGITVTAKRDQVTPTLEYTRLSIQEQARKMKLLSNAVKSGSVPSNTDPGAVAILGVWVKRDPLTQYSGLSLTSTDPVFGKYLARFLPKVFPLAVPVPGEQRGRGWLAEGPVEWVWNTKIVWEAD